MQSVEKDPSSRNELMREGVVTTSNGHEIEHPREKLNVEELQSMLDTYNLQGENPEERLESFRRLPKESFATFLTDLNRRLQGSDDTLVSEKTMTIGEHEGIAPEERYDLFSSIYEKIQGSDPGINPSRVGDALALSTVVMHPFVDGNGRTARMMGYIFRADFSNPEDLSDFETLAEPRDDARERGGFMINGYIPYFPEGSDQSNPTDVINYVDQLMHSDAERLYTGPYGQAQLSQSHNQE